MARPVLLVLPAPGSLGTKHSWQQPASLSDHQAVAAICAAYRRGAASVFSMLE